MTPDEFERRFVVGLGGKARETIWEAVKQYILTEIQVHDIKCELWLNGSFITKCPEPDDIDGSIMLEASQRDLLSDGAVNYLNQIDDSESPFHCKLDVYLCVVYPKGHELRGGLNDPDGWAEQWSREHNSDWLKGFVVIPFR